MGKLALVTGASSGIGKELARYHAKQGGDLIICARRQEVLEKLKAELEKEYGVTVHVIATDLSKMDAAQKLFDEVQERNLYVDYLINDAGFGGQGSIIERNLQDDVDMIVVNVVSLVALTHLFAKRMSEGHGGKILNLGSVAGFIPGPKEAVYFASKAFVKSFSQAVDQELKGKGVTSTVLCPGMVGTEFVQRANLEDTYLGHRSAASAESVAKRGYNAMMSNKLLVMNEYGFSFFLQWVLPFIPRRMALMIGETLNKH
jgi:short-subunit dehydrogenase